VRVAAYLILTPIFLYAGWAFLGFALVGSSGLSDRTGRLLVNISALLMIPLGVAFGWRYRHRSLRVPAHLILTPVVLSLGWWLLCVLLLWATGQQSQVYGTLGTILILGSLLMVPLGVAVGWRRYRARAAVDFGRTPA